MSAGLDYLGGRIPRLFRKMFFPTLLGMVFNALITVFDGIFIGQGVGPDGIAAVNIIAPLFMVIAGIGLMFGIGASVVAGIALAHDNSRRAGIVVTQGIFGSLAIMLGVVATCFFFPSGVASLLGSSARLMPKALDYLLWMLPGFMCQLVCCIGLMVIRLDGSPKYAMLCNAIPSVVNIILDWVYIFPLGMGVKGAAIATSISLALGAVMVVVYIFRFSYVIKFIVDFSGLLPSLWRQVRIGSSALVAEIAMSVMMLTGNYVFMEYFGEAGVAAYSIGCYLFPILFMISNAVAQSAQPIISVNFGARNVDRIREAFRLSVKVAVVCGVLSGIGIAAGAPYIVEAFIDPTCEAAAIARRGLPVMACCSLFFAVNVAFIGFYQSIEWALRAMAFTLLRGVVFLVPAFILLPKVFPAWGMWGAIPASELFTLIVILLTFRPLRLSPVIADEKNKNY